MTKLNTSPRTAPGSHNPEFKSTTPMGDWYRENRNFVLMMIVALSVGLGYNYYAPRNAASSGQATWSAFAEIRATPGGAYTSENLGETLTRARSEEIIHPWVVLAGIQDCLSRADNDSLQTLTEEARALQKSGSLGELNTPSNGSQVPVFELAIARAEEALAGGTARVFDNPTPTGRTISITLSDGADVTYEISIGLFEDVAPNACEAFIGMVNDNSLIGRVIGRSGAFGLTFKPEELNDELDGLATETAFGYYHKVGALSFNQKPGAAHLGDLESLELTIKDSFHLDGRTTVFGKL